MITSVIASIIAFISTNIDDLFILMLLYAQTKSPSDERRIILGHTFGIGLLVLISLVGAFGTKLLPVQYIRFLGLIPMVLGIRTLWAYLKNRKDNDTPADYSDKRLDILSVAAITIANGADNVGVYLPLFAGFDVIQPLTAFAVFFLMNLLWCRLGSKTAALPFIRQFTDRYKDLVMGIVFILIGLYVLI